MGWEAPLATESKVVAELSFGFWRYLLARRYTALLRPAFPHLGGSDRRTLELPVTNVHRLRNRVAHHEPVIAESIPARYDDILTIVGAVDPALRTWVDSDSRVRHCPPNAPHRGGRRTREHGYKDGPNRRSRLLAYHNVDQGYPSEPTSPPPLRRERDAKAVRREGDPGWAGDPGGRAASVGPSLAWGSR